MGAGRLDQGKLPEWLKGADCKSVGFALRRFESYTSHSESDFGIVLGGRQTAIVQSLFDPHSALAFMPRENRNATYRGQ